MYQWIMKDSIIKARNSEIVNTVKLQARGATKKCFWPEKNLLDVSEIDVTGQEIDFKDGSWVKIARHSSHSTEYFTFMWLFSENSIGDFDYIHCVDSYGNEWFSDGHACEGPIFTSKVNVGSAKEFTQTVMTEDKKFVSVVK